MVIDAVKIKKNSLVYYKKFFKKQYNEKSKNNLKQNLQKVERQNKLLSVLKKQKKTDDIHAFTATFKQAYQSATEKAYKTTFSKQQAQKISEISNVFISALLSEYKQGNMFKQRSVSFVTLTLPSTQMHTDKEIIYQFVKFIDHLKKVKNYTIENGQTTKNEALALEHYLWRAETQENGNIHFHLLFDTFFNHEVLKRVWNQYLSKLGYLNGSRSASIHSIRNLNDVGAYVTKYMTKEPLNDHYNDLVKNNKISRKDLDMIPDEKKYRRTIIGKTWGCSRSLTKLKYATFEDSQVSQVAELKAKLVKVEMSEDVPDFIEVYSGKIRNVLKKCSYKLQGMIKGYYKFCFGLLYKKEIFERLKNEAEKELFEIYFKLGDLDYLFADGNIKIQNTVKAKNYGFRFPN